MAQNTKLRTLPYILVRLEPGTLGEGENGTAVEATPGGKVDIFDAGFREAQLRGPQPVGQALVGSHRLFAIKHQREPVLMTEFIGLFG